MRYQVSEPVAARRRFPLYLVDATDGITPETGEAAGQPQVDKNGGGWVNTTATLTAIGNGHYYVELTATELDTLGYFAVRYKSAAMAEANGIGQVEDAGAIRSGTAQASAVGYITLDASASAVDDFYNGDIVVIVQGTGSKQAREITDYTGSNKRAAVTPDWAVIPSTDSVFILVGN